MADRFDRISEQEGHTLPAETHVEGGKMDRDEVLTLIRDRLADILEIDPDSIKEGDSFVDDLDGPSLSGFVVGEGTLEQLREGLLLREGTIVDATLIAAPPSTKNRDRARDPDMHQARKGKQWHFGMKAHIGVDLDSGLVHTVLTTPAGLFRRYHTVSGRTPTSTPSTSMASTSGSAR